MPASPSQTVGVDATLGATATSGLAVSFATASAGVCSVSGTTLSFAAVGSCVVTASQIGNAGYLAASDVSRTFDVTVPGPTISAVNGKALYFGNSFMSCANCHGPLANMQKVQNGANNPSAIINAINNASGMSGYKGLFNTQQLADLAAFIDAPY